MPIHPALVHIPIGAAVLTPLVAIAVLVAWWRKWLEPRAWALVLGLQIVLVVSAFAALRTGGDEEEVVERVVAESYIHEHEEAAEAFTYTAVGVLVLAAAAMAMRKDKLRVGLAVAATAGSLAVLGLGLRAGHAGGELVYVHGAAQAHGATGSSPPAAAEGEADKHGDHDDDDD